MDYLSRREHSRQELIRKLSQREAELSLIEEVVDELSAEGLQSDKRFCESYVCGRLQRGYGPLYIKQALQQRGLEDFVIQEVMAAQEEAWQDGLWKAWQKRFGAEVPSEPKARARQMRFLQQRGFTSGQINQMFKEL